jgi:hypothetical protein
MVKEIKNEEIEFTKNWCLFILEFSKEKSPPSDLFDNMRRIVEKVYDMRKIKSLKEIQKELH